MCSSTVAPGYVSRIEAVSAFVAVYETPSERATDLRGEHVFGVWSRAAHVLDAGLMFPAAHARSTLRRVVCDCIQRGVTRRTAGLPPPVYRLPLQPTLLRYIEVVFVFVIPRGGQLTDNLFHKLPIR